MFASDRIELTQESAQRQAFHPILATLFFVATTAPMVLGWGGDGGSRQTTIDFARDRKTGNQVVEVRCTLTEHNQPGHQCICQNN